ILSRDWSSDVCSSDLGFVLDGHAPGQAGGSGQRLDAASVPADLDMPWLLAGGLTPDNVGEAVRTVRPWGVDVAGGIELAPGIKGSEGRPGGRDSNTRR